MASPAALMASSEAARRDIAENFRGFEETSRSENAKQSTGRPRKNSKSNDAAAAAKKQKKQPQRGMGVAQLERLRLQDRWKRITHIEPNPNHNHNDNQNHNHHSPLLHQCPNLNNFYFLSPTPPPIHDPTPFGPSQPPASLLLQRLGLGGSRVGAGSGGLFSGQFNVDPYAIGAPSPGSLAGVLAHETSKELSSMPNNDQCGRCHKKKRVGGGNSGCYALRDRFVGPSSGINGCDLLGLNLGENRVRGPSSHAGYAGSNALQEEEVEVQRKEGMEYELFPAAVKGGDGRRGDTSSEVLGSGFSSEASVAVLGVGDNGSAAGVTTTSSFDASNSVDLSLKLSY